MASQPIADLFEERLLSLIDEFRMSGISVSETVGVLALTQHQIMTKAFERTNEEDLDG